MEELVFKTRVQFPPSPPAYFLNNTTISNVKPLRINHAIKVPQVRVIDDAGQQLGVMDTGQALMLAKEKNLDLVEVSPLANPPVCKLVNWGAFQYQQDRLNRKQKAKQRQSEIKGIRLTFKIGQHDLDVRRGQTQKFLDRGDRVKLEMILRGREMRFKERASEIMNTFVKDLGDKAFCDGKISMNGNRLSLIIGMKK